MGNGAAIVFCGIAPHPPIMVPEVGHESSAEVRDSIAAMAELTRRVIASGAQTLVLISPHAPLVASAFVAYDGPLMHGSFANFRAPATTVKAQVDEELLSAIALEAAGHDYSVRRTASLDLDHGTTVPLHFLQRNGWDGRVVALGYSFLTTQDHLRFGACISKAVNRLGRPVAFVASGDLSHRLKPGAPAGYEPRAHLFDEEVVAALRANSPERIVNIDEDLRRTAGECGYRSMLVALGVTKGLPLACEVLNYEAPFGVGYMVAQITNREPVPSEARTEENSENDGAELPALARRAVEAHVLKHPQSELPDNPSELLQARAGCFVSIKTGNGELRGCVGTIEPTRATLAEELIANAISAAAGDPRFNPVEAIELPHLRYSVDVLSRPEPTTLAELDPNIYGVIVENQSGDRRGLLLPNLEGVDPASQQVQIAAAKAGITRGTPIRLARFRVQRYGEQ